jgi:hypothetical protein
MKNKLIGAIALTLALSPVGISNAFAEQAAAPFRSVAPQTFSSEDLQRYGLDADAVARGEALQAQGYRLLALSPEEAEAYRAGSLSTQSWILIGIAAVIIIAVAA